MLIAVSFIAAARCHGRGGACQCIIVAMFACSAVSGNVVVSAPVASELQCIGNAALMEGDPGAPSEQFGAVRRRVCLSTGCLQYCNIDDSRVAEHKCELRLSN